MDSLMTSMQSRMSSCVVPLLVVLVSGCGGPSTAVKLAVKIVGKAVDEVTTRDYGQKLIGRDRAQADEAFGAPVNALQDVDDDRRKWLLYPVELDVLDKHRWIVEVHGDRIVALTKAEIGKSMVDIPRKLILQEKVKGLPPAKCEAVLDMGPALLTVRNTTTGQLAQLYDARIVALVEKHHYCLLRYDQQDRCEQLDFVEADASTKDQGP